METTETVRAVTTHGAVVGQAGDGSVWVGTAAWLVRDRTAKTVTSEQIDRLVVREFTEDLVRVRHGEVPVRANAGALQLCRLYLRSDGITVWLDDAVVTAIEEMCSEEDDEGNVIVPALSLTQADHRWSQVGFFDSGELVAIAMPIRGINAHLTDGAGRPVS